MAKKITLSKPSTFSIATALRESGEERRIPTQVEIDAMIDKADKMAALMKCGDGSGSSPLITKAMTGSEWLSLGAAMQEQKQLCGPLWYEGEVCVLFADTNVGKSILAVQIADMISKGGDSFSRMEELAPQTLPQPVVYADFELSTAQFARRYSVRGEGDSAISDVYAFSNNLIRVELSMDAYMGVSTDEEGQRSFADMIIADLERHVGRWGAQVLIIDNITFMAQGTENACDALPLMRKLGDFKRRLGISVLILAHTPKRNPCNPLNRNDLQGSKMIINFADSAFAVGESVLSKDMRYIKQIKQRNTEQVYGSDSVLTCRIGHVTPTFVGFTSDGVTPESDHLAQRRTRVDDNSRALEVRQLHGEGSSVADIMKATGLSRAHVYRLLQASRQVPLG